ncbi:MAG TPA: DUF2269 family protein [Galbitalea sp.]|jgi:uncharacterized membrane protein
MDTLFTILHVVGAVFIVGPMAVLPQSGLRAIRTGNSGAVTTLAKSTFIFTIASIVVALLGFALVGMADPKYHLSVGTPWVLSAVIAYALALVLSLVLVVPGLRGAARAMASNDGAVSSKAPGYAKVAAGSGLVSLLLVVVVVLMVWKP